MSKKIITDLDLNGNHILNAKSVQGTADKVAHSLTVKYGSHSVSFDGSTTQAITVTAADIGGITGAIDSKGDPFPVSGTKLVIPLTAGYQGIQGLQGYRGIQGDRGIQGLQGIPGTNGTQGIQGFQGYQGYQGIAGKNGSQGIQGFRGYQGIKGLQGIQAQLLNKIVETPGLTGVQVTEKLVEVLGHTPTQVIVGATIGVIVGLLV